MLGLLDQFSDHSLYHTNVTIFATVSQIDMSFESCIRLLSKPPIDLPTKATQKLVEKPTMSSDTNVPAHPSNKIGLRPTLSDIPPQKRPVRDSERAKAEMKTPA